MGFAKESGHFYAQDGSTRYEVENKSKGGMRKSTLRDCKKHGWVPSYTTVMQIAAKPGLEKWKRDQILMSALTLPKIKGESLDQFAKRVEEDARQHAEQARNKGTEIHGVLENYFVGGQVLGNDKTLIQAVFDTLNDTFGEQGWKAEKSFACKEGYGGKTDLHSDEVVVDFKTKEFTEDNLPKIWPDHTKQLGAYAYGLGLDIKNVRCAILFVSTSVPGLVHLVELKKEEIEKGLFCFMGWLEVWKREKQYDSEF